jgi:hypothetical protein
MNKIYIIFLIFLLSFLLTNCKTVKKGFSLDNKNKTEEFLVEKKSPLVIPPDFDQLPPPTTSLNQDKEDKNKLESIIKSASNSSESTEILNEQNNNLEKSILEKIKSN